MCSTSLRIVYGEEMKKPSMHTTKWLFKGQELTYNRLTSFQSSWHHHRLMSNSFTTENWFTMFYWKGLAHPVITRPSFPCSQESLGTRLLSILQWPILLHSGSQVLVNFYSIVATEIISTPTYSTKCSTTGQESRFRSHSGFCRLYKWNLHPIPPNLVYN